MKELRRIYALLVLGWIVLAWVDFSKEILPLKVFLSALSTVFVSITLILCDEDSEA